MCSQLLLPLNLNLPTSFSAPDFCSSALSNILCEQVCKPACQTSCQSPVVVVLQQPSPQPQICRPITLPRRTKTIIVVPRVRFTPVVLRLKPYCGSQLTLRQSCSPYYKSGFRNYCGFNNYSGLRFGNRRGYGLTRHLF